MADASERDANIYRAKLAEQAERYSEMAEYMKLVVMASGKGAELSVEERNLLSVAYKNVIGANRASWRTLGSLELRATEDDKKYDHIRKTYRAEVERDLQSGCEEIISLIDEYGLEGCGTTESKVFYSKMKGDYNRYLAEYLSGETRNAAAEKSMLAYNKASEAAKELSDTHPVRLGLALNMSVFYYEILENAQKACDIAKQALENAYAELDSLSEESYKDSTLIMQLLRDNLTLWSSDIPKENELQDVEDNDG